VRDIIKNVQVTADQVFRAVIEDWESVVGYVADPIDINQELSGGGKTADDLPQWNGIAAGVERIVGLLGMLEEYLRSETSMPISLPLGALMDITTRILSIPIPSSSQSSRPGDTRLHPAIDRDERDGLWSGMPGIYVASLQLLHTLADRLQYSFLPLAPTLLDQLAWVFPSGKHDPTFRLVSYQLFGTILLCAGQSQTRKQISKLSSLIHSSCHDLFSGLPTSSSAEGTHEVVNSNGKRPHKQDQNHNADTFLKKLDGGAQLTMEDSDLITAANELLPLFASHIPRQYLDISLRSLIERTAIMTHNKDAMVACVLNAFVGKNGKTITSILPHLASRYHNDAIVETLLRPRLPMVPSTAPGIFSDDINEDVDFDGHENEDEDEDTDMLHSNIEDHFDTNNKGIPPLERAAAHHGFGDAAPSGPPLAPGKPHDASRNAAQQSLFSTTAVSRTEDFPSLLSSLGAASQTSQATSSMSGPRNASGDTNSVADQPFKVAQLRGESHMEDDGSESDDESVHLVGGLDTDSESEE
jgi:hypothetical protein